MFLNLLFLFTDLTLFAQKESCDDIKKITSELKETTTYISNAVWIGKSTCISAMKIVTPKINGMALVFTNYSSTLDVEQKGVYLKFDDGTFYRNPDIKIDVEVYEVSRWQYKVRLILNKAMVDTFTSKKITDVNFGYSKR